MSGRWQRPCPTWGVGSSFSRPAREGSTCGIEPNGRGGTLLPTRSIPRIQPAPVQRTAVGSSSGSEQGEFDRLGNVLARVAGGSRPPVVLSAHLDSVFAREGYRPARREGDRLVGPGIGENAIGLSALVEVPHHLTGDSLPGDLWLLADVCEGGHGNPRGMGKIVGG